MNEYSEDKVIYAKDSAGVDIVTVADTAHKIMLPKGLHCKNALIQVQAATLITYDPLDDCVGFGWASAEEGPYFLFDNYGKVLGESKIAAANLGYIKAPAGYKIVIHTFQ